VLEDLDESTSRPGSLLVGIGTRFGLDVHWATPPGAPVRQATAGSAHSLR
jgi:hypothetical protein